MHNYAKLLAMVALGDKTTMDHLNQIIKVRV